MLRLGTLVQYINTLDLRSICQDLGPTFNILLLGTYVQYVKTWDLFVQFAENKYIYYNINAIKLLNVSYYYLLQILLYHSVQVEDYFCDVLLLLSRKNAIHGAPSSRSRFSIIQAKDN